MSKKKGTVKVNINFEPHFAKYEAIVKMAEDIYNKVRHEFSEEVTCKVKCSDCCHALFDLSIIEAIYIKFQFDKKYKGKDRELIIDNANRADRKIYRLKRDAHKEYQQGMDEIEIIGRMSMERVRCPLLNQKEECELYEFRPITCRVYGIPTASSGKSHTCGKSKFAQGKQYPTINMDIIHKQLYDISTEFVKEIKSKHKRMNDMLVPLSMALLTDYDEEYLGIKTENTEE